MTQASDYLEQKLRDHIFRGIAYTPPTTLYLSLHTANPTDTGSGAEVSGGSYARKSVANSSSEWSSDGTGLTSNVNTQTFPTATGSWGTLTHFGVWDAASSGNLLIYGALNSSAVIGSGQVFSFNPGEVDITFASMTSNYLADKVRDFLFRGGSFAAPATLYLALYTTATTAAGGGTEATGGSYARLAIPCNTSNWSAPSTTSGLTDNVLALAFAMATGSWGSITHFALRDASSGGNLIVQAALGGSVAVAANNTFTVPVGALDVTIA
jgi:hypothetical protein